MRMAEGCPGIEKELALEDNCPFDPMVSVDKAPGLVRTSQFKVFKPRLMLGVMLAEKVEALLKLTAPNATSVPFAVSYWYSDTWLVPVSTTYTKLETGFTSIVAGVAPVTPTNPSGTEFRRGSTGPTGKALGRRPGKWSCCWSQH